MLFSTILQSSPHIKAGKLRAVAVSTRTRSRALPEVPTMVESGLPNYVVAGWYGVLAPAKTPRPIIDRLNREMVRILHLPEVVERLAADGSEPVGNTPEEFGAHIRAEIEAVTGPIPHFARGGGCARCRGSGFAGRLGVFELLVPDENFIVAVSRGATLQELTTVVRQSGQRNMRMDGFEKIRDGQTTFEEVVLATAS
jgi:hypothetical protein